MTYTLMQTRTHQMQKQKMVFANFKQKISGRATNSRRTYMYASLIYVCVSLNERKLKRLKIRLRANQPQNSEILSLCQEKLKIQLYL